MQSDLSVFLPDTFYATLWVPGAAGSHIPIGRLLIRNETTFIIVEIFVHTFCPIQYPSVHFLLDLSLADITAGL